MKKKRFILREWVKDLLEMITMLCVVLIICTSDNVWTIQYGVFLGINLLIIIINIILLDKYTR